MRPIGGHRRGVLDGCYCANGICGDVQLGASTRLAGIGGASKPSAIGVEWTDRTKLRGTPRFGEIGTPNHPGSTLPPPP